MIEEDQIITPPQMVISPDHLIEFLMPFFYQTEDQSKIQSILGKMLSNAVISIDKKVFQYFAEYIAIETEMGASGAKRIMDITLDDYVSDELLQLKESSSPQDFDREFLGRIETKLDQLDESEELKSRLTRLIELAKTPPPKTPSGPKIQISFIGKLTQLLDTKLPVFCDPKPKSEKEYQREINKLLRAHDYYPNKDKDQVTFSTRGAIPDFTFNEERVAIEAKYIGDRTTVSDIIEQMAADITLYSKNYDIIIFTIYDGLSKITDVDFFKKDFEEFGHIIIVTK